MLLGADAEDQGVHHLLSFETAWLFLYHLAPQSTGIFSPGSLLEMQESQAHPRPIQSESAR